MPGSAAKVLTTERQQEILQDDLVTSRTTPVRLVQRATIVVRAFAGIDNADIAPEIGLGPDAVGAMRNLFPDFVAI